MKLSDITKKDVEEFIRAEPGTYSKKFMEIIMDAAKSYIIEYTGITREKADEIEDLCIAYFVLCQDMFDNRSMYVDKSNLNQTVKTILDMHSENLIV